MENKIRILVADDHTVMRQGLARMLSHEPDIEIFGEAANGAEAIDLILKFQPDVILMDIGMPVMDGIEATRNINNAFPEIKIIGLSMHLKEDMGAEIIKAGAVDFVSKSESKDQLLTAIRKSIQASIN